MTQVQRQLNSQPGFSGFLSLTERTHLTKVVMRLLDEWELSTANKLALLGLRETSRNMLIKYRNLDSILPNDQDKLERVGLLLNVYKNLFDLYPENKAIRTKWVKQKNSMLENRAPLEIMLSKGLFGIASIMRFLDLQMVS